MQGYSAMTQSLRLLAALALLSSCGARDMGEPKECNRRALEADNCHDVTAINLDFVKLSEAQVHTVISAIAGPRMTFVRLRENHITPAQIEAILRACAGSATLQDIVLRDNPLSPVAVQTLRQILVEHRSLKNMDLRSSLL